MNWDIVLDLAEEHGVPGMLAKRLEEAGLDVPPATREKLHSRVRAQSLFALGMTAELFRILDDFSNSRIEAIPVKGPVISQVAHGDPALRSFGDLDFLLRQKDIPAAILRMYSLGFASGVPAKVLDSGKIPGEYLFRRSGTPQLVEFHTECTFRHYPKPMRIGEMMARKRTVQLEGRAMPALSLEDDLVFDCVHGSKDFWERLMWVLDVAAIVTRYPQIGWRKTLQAAADVGAERMLLAGVCLAAAVFDLKLPAEIAEAITRDPESNALAARVLEWLPYAGARRPNTAERATYRMRMAGGGVAGLKYLARLSFTPAEDDWDEGGTGRRSRLWEAVRRPFRLLRKYQSEK